MNIGQLAQAAGVSAKMIRYYESVGLIPIAYRSQAGYRQYATSDVQTLSFIRRARALGFSLERIKALLGLWCDQHRQSVEVKALAEIYIAELDEQISHLQEIRLQLEILSDACPGNHRSECSILEDLSKV